MKKPIAILIFFLASLFSFGQGAVKETIHLKNGTVVTGFISEYVPNKSYTIVTADGNKFVFEVENIAKITRSIDSKPTKSKSSPGAKSNLFESGYQGYGGIGLGAGMGTYGIDMFKLDFVNGKRFSDKLFAGIGIGLRQPMEEDFPAYLPLYANASYNLSPEKDVVPVASLSVGAAFNSDQGLKEGGLMLNPSLGAYINKFDNFMIHASLGYDVMHMQFFILRGVGTFSPYIVKKTRFSEAFVVNLGLVF